MLRLLIRLGKWLDSRFPEKREVTIEAYDTIYRTLMAHDAEFSEIRAKLDTLERNLEPLVSRIGVVETSAVHKGAVADLVSAVKAIKDEFQSLKTSLGMGRIGNAEIRALLNGEPITEEMRNDE